MTNEEIQNSISTLETVVLMCEEIGEKYVKETAQDRIFELERELEGYEGW